MAHIECVPVDGVLFQQHDVVSMDNICEVSVDGKTGFCDLELSTDPRGGSSPLTLALGAATEDGLSRR